MAHRHYPEWPDGQTAEMAIKRARYICSRPGNPAYRPSTCDKGFVYFIQAGEAGPIKIGTGSTEGESAVR